SLSVGLGPSGFDVDTRSDLIELAARLEDVPCETLARTREAIARAVQRGASRHASEAVNGGLLSSDRPTAQFPFPLGEG
ncbi:MAG: hypothetical protein ACRDIY_09050, partial [Chloroflexota bacterium]